MSGRGKGRQLRADAQRNHELIITTTRALLPEHGPDISMEQVARDCGVGIGTLYRRFGSREALISTVADIAFQRITAHADRITEVSADAWEAFTRFLRLSIPDLKTVMSLSIRYPEEWELVKDSAAEHDRYRALTQILERFVHRAQESGSMRTDVTTDDVAVLLALTLRPIPGRDDTERYLTIMLDGLRKTGPTAR